MDLLTGIDDGIARVTFNRPAARNAVTRAMLADMSRFLEQVASARDVRCVLISGTGEHFMGGADLRGFDEMLRQGGAERARDFEARVRNGSKLILQLARLPQPVVVKVRGAAAGVALGFIGAADFVLCGASAVFLLAQVGIGAIPDGGTTWWLPRLVGPRRAREIAMLAGRFGADDARAMGLVNRVVPDGELDAAVDALVARLVAAPVESLRQTKQLLDAAPGNSLAEQLELEARGFGACAGTDDFVEGVRAFIEKRPARFGSATD